MDLDDVDIDGDDVIMTLHLVWIYLPLASRRVCPPPHSHVEDDVDATACRCTALATPHLCHMKVQRMQTNGTLTFHYPTCHVKFRCVEEEL